MFGKHWATTLGIFALDRISINDKISVMLGTRYDYRYLEERKSEGQLSPKIGLSYQINDNTTFRLSVGQAFRAPSLAETYLKEEINSGLNFVQNPNLKSEKLRLYSEIGVKHKLLNFLEIDSSIFVYDYTDMILWKQLDDNDFQVTNLSSSMISGAETGVRFSWKGLSTIANYTYIDARDTTKGRTDNTLPYKPKHSVYTAIDYQYSRFMIGTSLRYVSKVVEAMFHPVDAPKAFYVINAKLSCKLSGRVTLSLAIDNILNRQYEEMERYRMSGRSIVFRAVVG
jgi:outer membrane receptor protein involved in Fe transport